MRTRPRLRGALTLVLVAGPGWAAADPAPAAALPTAVSTVFLSSDLCRLDAPGLVAERVDVDLAPSGDARRRGWRPLDGKSGTLRTAPVVFVAGVGSRLLLDVETAGGEVRAQFLDVRGEPIPGFSFADCAPVAATGPRQTVEWTVASGKDTLDKGLIDLSRLDRQTVRLEFRLHGACLFGFAADPGRESPLRLDEGPHLLIDDYLVARADGLARVTRAPKRLPDPAVAKSQHPAGKVSSGSLSYDPRQGLFRMWHWAPGSDGVRTRMIYRESQDGLRWPGEGKEVFSFNGFGTAVFDEGPDAADPGRRFKLGYFVFGPPPHPAMGMHVAFSPDGLHWTPYEGNPVLPYYPPADPRWNAGVGDIIDPFWDPVRRRYGCFVKMMTTSDREFGLQSRTVRPGLGTRLTGRSESLDFLHWEAPGRAFVPDDADEGVTEFYGATALARGDLLLAFVRILRDDLPAEPGGTVEGIGYTALATSRDGRHWQRFREPFLDRNPRLGAYDRAFAWVTGAAAAGDRVFLSYAAYNQGHKTGDRQCGIATLARDRFVAREAAGGVSGSLVTRLLAYGGRGPLALTVNVEAGAGALRARVLDAEGAAIPGFSFDECLPVTGDDLDQPVRWARPLEALRDRAFRLEFSLRNARLYGFSLGAGAPERGTGGPAATAPPVEIPTGVAQLFVDDALLDARDGLKRTLRQPKKDDGGNAPAIAIDGEFGSVPATLEANGTIVFDPRLKRHVLFALAFSPSTQDSGRVRLYRFTSPDAMAWTRGDDGSPQRLEFDLLDAASGRRATGIDLFSCAYNERDAAFPYQGWLHFANWGEDLEGIYFVRSADGRTWERGRQIMRSGAREIRQDGRVLRGPGDVTTLYDDRAHGRFLAVLKFSSPGYVGPQNGLRSRAYAFVDRLDAPLDLNRVERVALVPAAAEANGDMPHDEYYASTAWRYESLWLGGLKVWHGGGDYPYSAAGCAFLKLAVSRDGLNWAKVPFPNDAGTPEVFIPNGPEGGSQGRNDGGYITEFSQGPLRIGDELIYYYGCSSWGKKQPRDVRVSGGGIFRARLRVDGFVSVDGGTLTTKPLAFSGRELFVNGVGPIEVEALEATGEKALGKAKVVGDSLRHAAAFGGKALGEVAPGGVVRLRFTVREGGALYSFTIR